MDELGKVKRVVEKQAPVTEVLLVLDATTGQNGVVQARVFTEAVEVTGVVLTKLDGTAKGGIVVRVQQELGIPVKLIGLGEGADDLAPFEPPGLRGGDRRLSGSGPGRVEPVGQLQPVPGQQRLVGEQVPGAAVGDDDAAVEHHRPRAQLHRVGQVVGDHQQGHRQ